MSKDYFLNENSGFTLVELLVVITILGILSTIGLVAFTSAQAKGRDAERKSDLKQIASALEIYYNDHGSYPASSGGYILGCPSTTASSCSWGSGSFSDTQTIYLKTVPDDPSIGRYYYYRAATFGGTAKQAFQLYASLENTQDAGSCIGGNCGAHSDLPSGVKCGESANCNFSVTSPNTDPVTN